jgi:hypothetical protein
MKIDRRSIAAGLTVGVLAGGAAGAIAATTPGAETRTTSSNTTWRTPASPNPYRHGWDGAGTAWRAPATGAGWSVWHSQTAGPTTSGDW